jgi:hypothetical protein
MKKKDKFSIFPAQSIETGKLMWGIRCSHGFVQYTESKETATACIEAWNRPKKKKSQDK